MVTRALLLALLVAGCGYKGPVTRLEPPDPALDREAQKAAREAERQQVADGLTVPATSRPVRVDEIAARIEIRREDAFALPPEGTTSARPLPFPGDPVPETRAPMPIPPER